MFLKKQRYVFFDVFDPFGKIGVCCYSTEVERNAKYHVNITFYRYWLSGNYEQRLGRFSFKIGACCYTPLKTAQ